MYQCVVLLSYLGTQIYLIIVPNILVNVCHLILTCSGLPIPRGEARQCELATRIWKCYLHNSTVAIAQASQQQQQQQLLQQPAAPPPLSLKSLPNQGLSLAEAKDIKEKYGKCSATLRSNTGPVRCNRCSAGLHRKYSTGPKASSHDINWNCDNCVKILQQSNSASTSTIPSFSIVSTITSFSIVSTSTIPSFTILSVS